VVRVVPEVRSLAKRFDYLVPEHLRDQVRVGTRVRIPLGPRREGAWVVELGVEPPPGVALKPIAKVVGWGPPADVIDLAAWAAWRLAGRLAPLLVSASPPNAVRALPAAPPPAMVPTPVGTWEDELAAEALTRRVATVRLPPAADPLPVVLAACRRGPALVVVPEHGQARLLAARLKRSGVPVALHPNDWALGAAGCTVVGTRGAVWAPVAGLAAVVVLDEHDEALKEEQTVCWHARDVALERARRAGVPCVLVSPTPTLEALDACGGRPLVPSRSAERAAWPFLEVVDRTREDPWGRPLVSEALARHLRSGARVVCVLNTPGKARVLACASCRTLVRCERCGAAMAQDADDRLACRRCGHTRPVVCASCGATRLRVVRPGTARLREELSQVAGEEVLEVTATEPPPGEPLPPARLHVGTEAVLHRVAEADVVAFCDLDAELLAPRFRAAEQALSLLARAARLVGPRPGRLLVQTSVPRHEVLDAVLHADPGRLAASERARRVALSLPPASALASISGAGAEEYLGTLLDPVERPDGIDVLGPSDGAWLVRAADHRRLCDALAALERPSARLRVDVDPLRL